MTDALVILQTKLSSSEVRQVLLALGHPALLKQFDADQQTLYAVDRLNNGWRQTALVGHMERHFDISQATAYRRVRAALNHHTRYRDKKVWDDEPVIIAGRLPSRVV